MQELTDDQLDGLFRKSAEEFEPPYDHALWEVLQEQLEDRDRAAFWKRLLPWGVAVLCLLLLTGGGWYVAHRQQLADKKAKSPQRVLADREPVAINERPESTRPELTDVSRRPDSKLADATDHKPAKPVPGVSAGRVPGPETVEKANPGVSPDPKGVVSTLPDKSTSTITPRKDVVESVAVASRTRKIPASRPVSEPLSRISRLETETVRRAGKQSGSVSMTLPRLTGTVVKSAGRSRKMPTKNGAESRFYPVGDRAMNKGSVPTRQLDTDSPAMALPTPSEPESENRFTLPTLAELAIRSGQWTRPMGLKNREVVPPETAEPAKPISVPVPSPSMRGLSVRFVVSPDLSMVGLNNFSRPGTNVGLLLEYRLASRWSVQAGFIKSTKVYRALPNEYNIPSTWGGMAAKLESVDGQCTMFDIPINVRYDIAVKPRQDGRQPSRWFVSGGATSYIIRQENYDYNYQAHTYGVPLSWSNPNPSGFGFSQLNVSAGYERALTKRLSWQVEPFMKVPLKGVGYFKVDLLSTGVFFSIRYKL